MNFVKLVARRFKSWLLSGPVSVGLIVALIVVRTLAQSLGSSTLVWDIASGLGEPWWTVFTYPLWTSTWIHLVVDIAFLLSVGIWIERLLGSLWYAGIGFVSAWLGATTALGLGHIIARFDHAWGEALLPQYVSGVTAFLVAAAMAVSVRLDTLWRHRIQIVTFTILGVSILFSGSIDSLSSAVSALLGWAGGIALWGKERDRRPLTGTRQEGRVVVALVVAAVTVGTLMALKSDGMVGALANLRGEYLIDVDVAEVGAVCGVEGLSNQCAHLTYMMRSTGFAARVLTIMPLLLQLVLAWGLRGGRRAAMWATMVLQGGSLVVAVVHLLVVSRKVAGWQGAAQSLGFNSDGQPTARFIVPIVVSAVLLLLVAANSRLFTVEAAPGTYRRFWIAVGAAFALGLVVVLVVGLPVPGTFVPRATVMALVGDYLIRLLPAPALYLVSPALQTESVMLSRLIDWMALLPWLVATIALWMSFRTRALPGAISRDRYKEIVRATSAGTMAWMSTWDGNRFWKSPTKDAAIAYRADGGVALTVTDPAAKPEDLRAVLEEFAQFCVAQDLIPALYSVHRPVVEITDKWRWTRLQVAEETVLELPSLAFTGKKFQDVRTAINRAKKEGIEPIWTSWDACPDDLRRQVEAMSQEWASEKGLPEMGFTLGGLKELDDPEVRILLAVDQDGHLHGATSWMPVYDQGVTIGWTLDFMRRRTDGFRPVMEYMIAQAALLAKEEGYQILSLSGAPLAKAQAKSDEKQEDESRSSTAALDLTLEVLGKSLEPVYGFRSLLRFKAKFQPQYEPVYLAVPDVSSLAAAGLAIGHAYIPHMSGRDMARLAKAMRHE